MFSNFATRCLLFISLVFLSAITAAENSGDKQVDATSSHKGSGGRELGESANDQVLEEIVVTGSRIRRKGFETLQPALVFDFQTIEGRNPVDLATILNEQSGFTPTFTPMRSSGFMDAGQNYADYLGLGIQRTLTLVNGHRFPAGLSPSSSGGGLSVDLNTIPESLVDRVEVIAIGGAPIYGSDAVAGTVNVMLKQDFDGLEITADLGDSPEYGDFRRTRIAATWGTALADTKGNLTLSLLYADSDGLGLADRPATSTDAGFAPAEPDSPYSLQLYDNLVGPYSSTNPLPLYFGNAYYFNIFGNGIAFNISDPDSPMSQFDASGKLMPFVLGTATGSPFSRVGGDGLTVHENLTLVHAVERLHATALFNYELANSVRFIGEAWWSRTNAVQSPNYAWFNGPSFGGLPDDGYGNVNSGPIPVLIDSPFLSDSARESIVSALDVVHDLDGDNAADPTIDTDGDGVADAVGFWVAGSLRRLFPENGLAIERNMRRAVAGFEGEFVLGNENFYWETYVAYGEVATRNAYSVFNQPNFEQAIQVTTDITGTPVCTDPGRGCVPLNVLGTPSTAAVDYVTDVVSDEVKNNQVMIAANVSGDIWHLPAGPLAVAAGASYREESSSLVSDPLLEGGIARTNLTFLDPFKGEFASRELYLEAVIPLLGGELATPSVTKLDFEGAIRFVDNSVVGKDVTWTAGLRFLPIPDIELRGNITEAIRAPSITELFTPASEVGINMNDPCDQQQVNAGNHPEVRAENCAAAGIEQPFDQLRVIFFGTVSGNPDLESEIARSASFGAVFRPRGLDGLAMSMDWFDIKIENAIEQLSGEAIANACYDSANFPAEPACAAFTRSAEGYIDSMNIGFINISQLEFAGMQSSVNYVQDLQRFGTLNWQLNHLYTEKFAQTPGTDNTVQLAGTVWHPENRVTASVRWEKDSWSWFSQIRWLDKSVFDNSDDEFTRDVSGVGDWLILDTGVAYDWNDRWKIRLNIDNLFDSEPPSPCLLGQGCRRIYFSGVSGRYVTVSARARF